MGGINISQKHNLINKSKSPLFYALIATGILFVLAILAISIKLSFSNATGEVEGADDTAIATLNNVDILQAGTGQSVTIKGETLNENDYGDNTTRRTILNNNIVRYNANYNVTKVGQITFSITLPANNTIDEATIAESQGCLPNLSKLESADITNSDGTITKSYTNNKATCVRNITTIGSTNWQITAYLWGANNTKIQPTLAVSGETSTIKPEEISVVGRGDYGVDVGGANFTGASTAGIELVFYVSMYANVDNVANGALGISPIDNGDWSTQIDLPSDWYLERTGGGLYGFYNGGGSQNSVVYPGAAGSATTDGLTVDVQGAVTATKHCPTLNTSGVAVDGAKCYGSGFVLYIVVPADSLPDVPTSYDVAVRSLSAMVDGQALSVGIEDPTVNYTISNRGAGSNELWASWVMGNDNVVPVAWKDFWSSDQPVYIGENAYLGPWLQINGVPGRSESTNLNYCVTWDPSIVRLLEPLQQSPSWSGTYRGAVLADYGVEYGIITTSSASGAPSSARSSCGIYKNDERSSELDSDNNRVFFSTLDEANRYAMENNLSVNAARLWSAKTIANYRDLKIADAKWLFLSNVPYNIYARFSSSSTSDQWDKRDNGASSDNPYSWGPTITPGLLSHTLTAIPSSTNPGKEDHITITTKTYNKDTDSIITVNLPNGLTPKEGSFTITTGYEYNDETNTNEPIKAVLIEGEGQDYTITANGSSGGEGESGSESEGSEGSEGDVSYTITLDLDHIASTHHVPITGYDPIYPGESGVTNITLNSDTGLYKEVITTNNNNEDSDITNDDLPIAADNDGNGISHISTPIEFDVTVNEDTPSPSTLTINSTASGTGTDYASTTFKTASDTIAVANPPAMFGYDLVASSNNIYAGDNLTYDYSISNTTSSNTNDITMITVLPFNGDSRGTTGLKNLEEETTQASSSSSTITNPYTISNLSLSLPSDGAGGLDTSATKLYYTLDPKARELESNPETLALDSSITWQELELDSDGNIPTNIMTNLRDQGVLDSITALKLTTTTLPSSSSLKLNVALDNILATTPGSEATLANDITYLSYASEANQAVEQVAEQTVEGTTNTNTKTILHREGSTTTYSNGQIVSVHQNPNTVNYLGELLALSIPENEQTIQVDLNLNDVVIGNPSISNDSTNPVNHLSLTTATLRGYTLTAQTSTENGALVAEGNPLRLIPSIATKPTKGTAGWSANIAGSNNQSLAGTTWTAIPGSNQTPLNLYASAAKGRDGRNLTVTYGFSAANTIADTYSAKVVYTVTAGL